jgi:hypothetical protein
MKRIWIVTVALIVIGAGPVAAGTVNLITNSNFEQVYAAQRQTDPDKIYGRADHRVLSKFEGKAALPAGWMVTPSRDEAGIVS